MTRLRNTAPKEIWLVVDFDHDATGEEDFADMGEVTWCETSVGKHDVRYIRADLAGSKAVPRVEFPPIDLPSLQAWEPSAQAASGQVVEVTNPNQHAARLMRGALQMFEKGKTEQALKYMESAKEWAAAAERKKLSDKGASWTARNPPSSIDWRQR